MTASLSGNSEHLGRYEAPITVTEGPAKYPLVWACFLLLRPSFPFVSCFHPLFSTFSPFSLYSYVRFCLSFILSLKFYRYISFLFSVFTFLSLSLPLSFSFSPFFWCPFLLPSSSPLFVFPSPPSLTTFFSLCT